MAKLLDKLYNRIIEGRLKIESDDDVESLKETLGLDGKANIHYLSGFIESENPDVSNFNVGDLIIDVEYAFFGMCIALDKSEESKTFTLVGYYDDCSLAQVLYDVQNGWITTNTDIGVNQLLTRTEAAGKYLKVSPEGRIVPDTVSGGTQLYKHIVQFGSQTSKKVTFINNVSQSYSGTITTNGAEFFRNIYSNSLIRRHWWGEDILCVKYMVDGPDDASIQISGYFDEDEASTLQDDLIDVSWQNGLVITDVVTSL